MKKEAALSIFRDEKGICNVYAGLADLNSLFLEYSFHLVPHTRHRLSILISLGSGHDSKGDVFQLRIDLSMKF